MNRVVRALHLGFLLVGFAIGFAGAQNGDGTVDLNCLHFKIKIHLAPDTIPAGDCVELPFAGNSNPFGFSANPGLDVEGGMLHLAQPLVINGSMNPLSGSVMVCPQGLGGNSIDLTWIVTNPPGQTVQERCTQQSMPTTIVPPTEHATNNTYSVADPVSLATGELHSASTIIPDFRLGGPLQLNFMRFYGSFLDAGGFDSALGNNWMHNFEASLERAGDSARVRLFGGKVIRFLSVEGGWTLDSTEKLSHQLQGNDDDGFRFLDLSTELVYSFDTMGRLIKIEDRNGNALTVTQAADGTGPEKVEDGLGRSLSFTYTDGKLTKVEDQTGRSVMFTQTGDNLTAVTEPLGRTTTYDYPSAGRFAGMLISTTNPDGGKPAIQQYDLNGRVTTQNDGNGNTLQFSYDIGPGEIKSTQTDALNRTSSLKHAGFNDMTEMTDASGGKQLFAYDGSHRLTSYTNANGDTAGFSYHPASGYFAGSRDYQGNDRTIEYEKQEQDGFMYWVGKRLTFPDGTEQLLRHDAKGNLTGFTDRAGNQWAMTVNDRGQVLTNTNPVGGVAKFTYNDDGTLASVESAAGVVLNMEYDTLKRLAAVRDSDGGKRSYVYDAADNLLSETDESGRVLSAAFDANNRLETFTDGLGNRLRYTYDPNDHLMSQTDSEGNVTQYEQDAAAQLVKVTSGAGERLRMEYDNRGKRTRVFDGVGTRMQFAYDAAGRLVSTTDGLGKKRALSLDKAGRPTGVTTPGGEQFAFTYDSMGRLTKVRDPLGRTSVYAYNQVGDLITMDRSGIAAGFQRDALRNITAITDPNGGMWRRGYDNTGAISSVTDPLNRTTKLSYDPVGNVSKVETPLGVTTIDSDPSGRPTRRAMPDGSSINFTYDAQGQLTASDGVRFGYDKNGWLANSNGLLIERDGAARIRTLTLAPGKQVVYQYDARGRVIKVSDWNGGATDIAYDDADRLVSITRSNGVKTNFTYDDNDRLIRIVEAKDSELASIALVRDAAGQIASAERNMPIDVLPAPGVMPVSYDQAHQMSGATYDGLGRLTSDGMRQYKWDDSSRLTSIGGQGGNVQFTYDGLGNRISRIAGGDEEEFVLNYALPWTAVSVVRSRGADQRYYVHLPNGVLLYSIEASDNSRRYYHYDEMGNTTLLTDDAGAVTDSYAVTPYGEQVNHVGGSTQPFVYHGAYGVTREANTDLYCMRARYYDAGWARFLTRDPVLTLDPLAVNPYQFLGGNPLLYVDPTGRQAMKTGAGAFTQPPTGNPDPVPLWGFPLTDAGGFLTAFGNFRIAPYVTAANTLDDWVNAIVNGAADVSKVVQAFNPSAAEQQLALAGKAAFDARFMHWTMLTGDVAKLERVADAAQKFKTLGTGLAALGVTLDTGLVVYDGVQNGDGWRTVLDAGATAGGDIAVLATGHPAVLLADVVTGGSVSGGLTNSVVAADAITQMTTGRFTPSDAQDIKRRMTRKPGLSVVYDAGESWANRGVGGTFRALGQAFGLIN